MSSCCGAYQDAGRARWWIISPLSSARSYGFVKVVEKHVSCGFVLPPCSKSRGTRKPISKRIYDGRCAEFVINGRRRHLNIEIEQCYPVADAAESYWREHDCQGKVYTVNFACRDEGYTVTLNTQTWVRCLKKLYDSSM